MLRYLSARDSLGIVEYGSDVKARQSSEGLWDMGLGGFTRFGFAPCWCSRSEQRVAGLTGQARPE